MRMLRNAPLALWAVAMLGFGHEAAATPVPIADSDPGPQDALQRAEAAYAAGRAYLQAGNTLRAMEEFRAALRENPASIDALNGLAVALDRVGRFDLSRPQYETALALDPNAQETLHNFGLSLYLQGYHHRAIPMLRKAASLADGAVRDSSLALLNRMEAGPRSANPVMQASAPPARPAQQALAQVPEPAQQPAAKAPGPAQPPVTPSPEAPARLAVAIPTAPNRPDVAPAVEPPAQVAALPVAEDPAEAVAQAEPLPLAPVIAPSIELVRIGSGEWRLADAPRDPFEPEALAHVPLWTEADERAAALEEAARLAALQPRPEDGGERETAEGERGAPPKEQAPARLVSTRPPLEASAIPVRRLEHALHQTDVARPLTYYLPRQMRRREDVLPPFARIPADRNGVAEGRFVAPFQSDDPRLNAFAERMQRHGVDSIGRPRTPAPEDPREVLPGSVALLPSRFPAHSRRPSAAGGRDDVRPEAQAHAFAG